MSRPGLKYVSPGERSIPAVNSGKWNRATNYSVDFAKVLGDVGIKPSDTNTVELFLRYVTGGRFLCAAKRKRRKTSSERTYEALWMFIPDDCGITPQELADIIEQLPLIFRHKEAFMSQEGFEDILPGVFFEKENEVMNPEKPGDSDKAPVEGESDKESRSEKTFDFGIAEKATPNQEGWRVGYVNLECREDLETVLGCGYKRQYDNFGLILLCDNPVRVESILPRIFLPELALNRQMREIKEDPVSNEPKHAEENREDEFDAKTIGEPAPEEGKNVAPEESPDEEPSGEKSGDAESSGENSDAVNSENGFPLTEPELKEESEEPSESDFPDALSLTGLPVLSGEEREKVWKMDYRSFGIGFLVASALFLIIMLMR
ncbi:MAG: hypothetical protein K2J70_07335 [Muribaculaceae bacterium]|nr:hypothetical protein [Muribaculaceae bacterium]